MAARTVLKLLSKTCTYNLNPVCPPPFTTLTQETRLNGQCRSYSQPPCEEARKSSKNLFFQSRKISRSLENIKTNRPNRVEDYHEEPQFEETSSTRSNFNTLLPAADLNVCETAREFKQVEIRPEEPIEEGNPVYELAGATRSEENYYDVLGYMKNLEEAKARRLFVHLQPTNLKPYGSSENLWQSEMQRKKIKIVYPKITQGVSNKKKKVDRINKEVDSYEVQKEYPAYEEVKKAAVVKKSSSADLHKKNYSTKARKASVKSGVEMRGPKLSISSSFTRRASTALMNKKQRPVKITKVEDLIKTSKIINQVYTKLNENKTKKKNKEIFVYSKTNDDLLNRPKSRSLGESRNYNTSKSSPEVADCKDYITVKLGELKEECRKAKKCKPKKIKFGRLPKLKPGDCPCIEENPLKKGKPLNRLKPRFQIPDRVNKCEEITLCTNPRADDGYVIKPKSLPVIKMHDCPCVEREMTDFVIKRLPKKEIKEPVRVCPSVEVCNKEDHPRADDNLQIGKKTLPKLQINNCPCVEEPPLKDVPLKRLAPVDIQEPPKICIHVDTCDETPRADEKYKIKIKPLKPIKGDCKCVEEPPMKEVPPLVRLKKIEYVEPPREECKVDTCEPTIRADYDIKIKKKKLPVFKPKNCPCVVVVEEEPPSASVNLKRLKMRNVPKEKEKVCPEEVVCTERADKNYVIKPKQLPKIELKECPCIIEEMKDVPPLKRLVFNPVKEPPKICVKVDECIIPRADEKIKVERKSLPVLPPGNCPCIEPEPPEDVAPLKKLKKKPVEQKRICPPKEEECVTERADDNLKVESKQLPKLPAPDCPCIEAPPPHDVKPLKRLKKVEIQEPVKICPVDSICDETTRADEDDWLYWKRVEVKPAACDPPKKKKNEKSGRRNYSTGVKFRDDIFRLRYDVPRLPTSHLSDKSYNVIIDIKPSAPLILTQKRVEVSPRDSFVNREMMKKSKSESIDCVTFVIYKSNSLGATKTVKESLSDVYFNSFNRFISTCSTLCEYSEKSKERPNNDTTPSCECSPNTQHLQPRNPIIKEKEHFIKPFPADEVIRDSAAKGRLYYRTRKDEKKKECKDNVEAECEVDEETSICETDQNGVVKNKGDKKMSWWERIVNYFKARPNCPPPEEFKKMRLKEEAEKAAAKAGLCLYDPKEMLRKTEKELPKVITASRDKDECEK